MGDPPNLADELRRALDRLSKAPELKRYYLAGGTAIGLVVFLREVPTLVG
jgi:hypothetical protein